MAYIDTKYLGQCETCRHHRSGGCDTWCDYGECYQLDMLKIPTADVTELKHGTWKINFDGYYPYCSECGHEPKGRHPTEYCEKCGADMINYNEFKKEE